MNNPEKSDREIDKEIAIRLMGLKIRLGSPTLPEMRIEGGWKSPNDWLLLNDDGSVREHAARPDSTHSPTLLH